MYHGNERQAKNKKKELLQKDLKKKSPKLVELVLVEKTRKWKGWYFS